MLKQPEESLIYDELIRMFSMEINQDFSLFQLPNTLKK